MTRIEVLRIDAVHPLGGEFALFYPRRLTGPAARREGELEVLGWWTDTYLDTADAPGGEITARHLVTWLERRSPWPNLPLDTLIDLLAAEADHRRPELPTYADDVPLCVAPAAVAEVIDQAITDAVCLANFTSDPHVAAMGDHLAELLSPVLETLRHEAPASDRQRMDANADDAGATPGQPHRTACHPVGAVGVGNT